MSVPPESVVPPPAEPPVPPAPAGPPTGSGPTANEKQWATFVHLAALAGMVIPFGNVIGPLVIWLVKKDTMPFVDEQGKEALNFNITVTIAALVCMFLFLVLIGFVLFPLLCLLWLVFVVIAAIKASEGGSYRYPLTLRLIN